MGDCQVGGSVHAASDTASCLLSWRLFLPASWGMPVADRPHPRGRTPASQVAARAGDAR
ncbi:transposase [Streptomyces sp. NBC_01186]|nr:transposase [Streptomyces sp. NBC_01186]WSS39442.1 transposase [Streptomyces sp. NBC_01187]